MASTCNLALRFRRRENLPRALLLLAFTLTAGGIALLIYSLSMLVLLRPDSPEWEKRHLPGAPPNDAECTRLAAAAGALEERTILKVALDVGFPSKSTFNRVYKEQFGRPPSKRGALTVDPR